MEADSKPARGKGRVRGRGKKKSSDHEKNAEESNPIETKPGEPDAITLDLDADITQLEAPTFSTINKGPPEPMLRLNWDHKTHLIGEKVINPMIHSCDKCEAPILIYGRMIPCKHVFCLACAERECKVCPRCQENVVRVERTGLGTVFMCTFGGTRYGHTGCRRTYLSQRDLLAHINHRHVAGTNKESLSHNQTTPSKSSVPAASSRTKPATTHVAVAGDPRIQTGSNPEYFYKMHSPHTSASQSSHRQSSHYHSATHHSEHHSTAVQSNSRQLQAATTPQTAQRHLTVTSSQLVPPPDFMNQILVPNYPPPASNTVTPISGIRNSIIALQTHESNSDAGHSSVSLAIASNFHQAYLSSFTSSSTGIPFPVPPPNQPGMNIAQTTSQFYSNTPINYSLTSSQRPPGAQFSSNSIQPLMSQSPMIPNQQSTPQMVPPPRRTQFSRENVQQQLPVTQNHRWHQSNQSQFF